MLDALSILNGVFLAGVVASNVTLYSDSDYKFHTSGEDRESVTLVSTHREWWRDDGNGKCKYIGLMVPYVRDWPETIRHGEVDDVLQPESDKTAGQAFIFNRKVCEGKPDEAIFRVASIARTYGGFLKNHHFAAQDVSAMKEEDWPKWFRQVLERVERVAKVDVTAKDFLAFTAAAVNRAHASEFTPSAPSASPPAAASAAESTPPSSAASEATR